jgi:hypothetical protein
VLILKAPRPAVTYTATLTPAAGAALPLRRPAVTGRYRGSGAASIIVPATAAARSWQFSLTASTAADLNQVQDVLLVARYTIST